MATGAADIFLQCAFDGSRPYHRDCKCALHKLQDLCPNACSLHRTMSFPKKQPWKDCSLFLCFKASGASWD
ncbi:hypothetical protein JCGZ_03971 [Jatropha curcas]|uniref:Uncharacterized protein n=1 Tax=Jatropha curcas TaxID=180498 RepID=A0A067KUG4_JATCU|nr:hypothetical protein JCGZ_03971 [Jatropha curcas]